MGKKGFIFFILFSIAISYYFTHLSLHQKSEPSIRNTSNRLSGNNSDKKSEPLILAPERSTPPTAHQSDKRISGRTAKGEEPFSAPAEETETRKLETRLLDGDAVSASKVSELQEDGPFQDILKTMGKVATDGKKREEYIGRFNNSEEITTGTVVLQALECSSRLCAVSVSSASFSDIENYLSKALSKEGPPIYSITQVIVEKDGGIERRLVFSTDPSINSVSGL